MYFKGHGHVDLVTLGLSKLVGRCHHVMFVKVRVRNHERSLKKLHLKVLLLWMENQRENN